MVTFETKVWDGDWEVILKTGYLEKMIARCNYNFQRKVLIVNNVKNRKDLQYICQSKKRNGIISDFYFVEDYEKEVLDFFDIDKLSFRGGFVYSISELVSIYLCQTKYLLHISGDSIIINNESWIDESVLSLSDSFIASAPRVDFYDEQNPVSEVGNFKVTTGFSDQLFLVDTGIFRGKIYNEFNEKTSNYPIYAGNTFEKRVAAWMYNSGKYSLTHKKALCTSKNFEKGHDIFNIAKNRP